MKIMFFLHAPTTFWWGILSFIYIDVILLTTTLKDGTCHLEPNTHFANRERRENSLPPPPWNPKLLAPLAHRRPTLFLVNVTLISTQAPSHESPDSTYISTTTLSTIVPFLTERLTQFKTHQHLTTSKPKILHLECNTPMWVILNWRVFQKLLTCMQFYCSSHGHLLVLSLYGNNNVVSLLWMMLMQRWIFGCLGVDTFKKLVLHEKMDL